MLNADPARRHGRLSRMRQSASMPGSSNPIDRSANMRARPSRFGRSRKARRASRAASIAAARIAEGSSRPARTVRTASSESSTVLSPRLPLPRVIIASRPMAIRSGISDQEISVRPIVCFATAMRADAVIVPNDEDEACWIAFAEARKARPTSAGKLSRISATACQPAETVIPRSPSPSLPSWLLSSSVADLTPSAIPHAALCRSVTVNVRADTTARSRRRSGKGLSKVARIRHPAERA